VCVDANSSDLRLVLLRSHLQGGNTYDMAKGTGVFQPRYGMMAQQDKKSEHSSNKPGCEPTDGAMTPIVLALQQQLQLQQMQKVSRRNPRRNSVCSTSSSCVSSGSFASSGSFSAAAGASPLMSPCHSSSLAALSGPFATSSMNCMTSPQYQQQQQVLPAPQLCYEPLMVPMNLCPTQRTTQLELQHLLLLEQQEAELDAAIQQLLACKQQLALSTPVVPMGMPCPFPAPASPLFPASSYAPLATPQQPCIATNVSPVTAQLLVQQLGIEEQRLQAAEQQLQEQLLQAAEQQLQEQLQAEMLHLLDLVA
jgi:hypothetical protein